MLLGERWTAFSDWPVNRQNSRFGLSKCLGDKALIESPRQNTP